MSSKDKMTNSRKYIDDLYDGVLKDSVLDEITKEFYEGMSKIDFEDEEGSRSWKSNVNELLYAVLPVWRETIQASSPDYDTYLGAEEARDAFLLDLDIKTSV